MIKILLLIVSFIIVILTLLQGGKTNGLSGALTGSDSLSLFAERKERGTEKILTNTTLVFVILFFVLVVLYKIVEA